MIKKLQRRLFLTLGLILAIFFGTLLFLINYRNYRLNLQQSSELLLQLARHDKPDKKGRSSSPPGLPQDGLEDGLSGQPGLCVIFYRGTSCEVTEMNQVTAFSEEELLEAARRILTFSSEEGKYKSFLYLKEPASQWGFLYLMDVSPALERVRKMFLFSLVLALLGFFLLFWLSWALSLWLSRPVAEAFARQKQFISDASHELKTPLAIISANAELLENEIGGNKWLSYIRSETKRMSHLVNGLLSLARIENRSETAAFSTFSLSSAALGILLPFESVAYEQGTRLSMDIEEDMMYLGCEEQIKQVISILTDNALCHAKPGGTVKISLAAKHKKAVLAVSNTGEPIPPEEQTHIFDRFYRSDASRERSENHYGLGLAIAKAVAERHHAALRVQCEDGWTTFTLELPYS